MRAAAALLAAALLGALTAFALPRTGHAANPLLVASVDDSYTITLKDSGGNAVTTLPAGTYDIEVHDETVFHNFHLTGPGVDDSTTIGGTGVTTWTGVVFSPGTYHFQCDAHPTSMAGSVDVPAAGTTSTSATTTTTPPPPPAPPPPATTQATTTAGPPPPPPPAPPAPVRCVVPRVVGLRLAAARSRIARAHCGTGAITYRRRHARHGRVLAQRPRPGKRLAPGARVSLVVAR